MMSPCLNLVSSKRDTARDGLEHLDWTTDKICHEAPDNAALQLAGQHFLELSGRFKQPRAVVTHWPGSQKVWDSIPAATKIIRCKNLASNIHGSDIT